MDFRPSPLFFPINPPSDIHSSYMEKMETQSPECQFIDMRNTSCFLLFLFAFCFYGGLFAQRQATLLDHQDRIRVQKLNVLNSYSRETNLSITPDGRYLFFMSLRGQQPWSNSFMEYKGDSVYDGDIWYSRKLRGKWTAPQCMPYGVNTSQGEDEPNVSPDGRRVYFQSWNAYWRQTGGPYYVASRNNESWSRPQGLGGGITEFFRQIVYQATDGMAISPDEKTMILAVGQDYDGNMDLYMSKKGPEGWSYCKRLGISTPYNDRSVFLAGDGKTLYFASNGYEGYGGLDIFKTTLNPDGTFGEVINVGKPFNTQGDDYGLILTEDGMEAYFVRNGDIYYADLREADPRIRPSSANVEITHTIKGTVRDSSSWRGIEAEIIVLDARTKIPFKKLKTNSSGKYSFDIPNQSAVYDEIVMAEGFHKKRRRIKVQPASYSQTISVNFLLTRPGLPSPPVVQAPPPQPKPKEEAAAPKEKEAEKPSLPSIGKIEKTPEEDGPEKTKVDSKTSLPEAAPTPVDPYDFTYVAENNLTLLIDVSASMRRSDRLPVLKDAFVRLLEHMRPEDRISVVAYAGETNVLIEGVSAADTEKILDAIDRLGGSGDTKGKSALKKAYKLARDNYIARGNNRIIMATDGFFEIGDLYRTAEKLGEDRIALSIFTFGNLSPSREKALETLASKGNGNYANINRENIDFALLKEAKAVRK